MVNLRLKDLCKIKGITLNTLAERVGVSQPSISGFATGKIKPSLDTLEKIAEALEVPMAALFEDPKEGYFPCPHCGKLIEVKAAGKE